MVINTKDNFSKTNLMGKVYLIMQIRESILVSLKMAKKKEMVMKFIQMEIFMKGDIKGG